MGEGYLVYNNYIERVNSIKEDGTAARTCGGINISNGRPNSALYGVYQVKNFVITNNTIVNSDYGIRTGIEVTSGLTLAPLNVTVANNIMLHASIKTINEINNPIGTSTYVGNIRQSGSCDIPTGTNNNIAVSSGLLESGADFFQDSFG
jgi:poly(beta-D-mannuronate) lyase